MNTQRRRRRRRTHRRTSSSTWKSAQCHPKRAQGGTSCLDTPTLYTLRDEWNKDHPDTPIVSQHPSNIHRQLQQHMKRACSSDVCLVNKLVDQKEVRHTMVQSLFAPLHPTSWKRNRNEWLSNVDIHNVMEQYEEAYPSFLFLGPSPIDFDDTTGGTSSCTFPEVCSLSLSTEWNRGKRIIGIVFNTDKSSESGSHWFAVVIHLTHHYLLFFDSVGDPIPPEIQQFQTRMQQQAKAMGHPLRLYDTVGVVHQRGDTECGMYALHVIIQLVTRPSLRPPYFRQHRITDKDMEHLRSVYFNDPTI